MSFEHYPYDGCDTRWENLYQEPEVLTYISPHTTMPKGESNGGPGGARTPNPQFRRLMLYPIELQGRDMGRGWSRVSLDRTAEGGCLHKTLTSSKKSGVGNGNRTRNRRSHSPVLYQLSYSHHST
jgi:hypothetical protein